MQLGAALGRTTQYVIRKLLGTGRIPCDTPTKADGAETLGDTPITYFEALCGTKSRCRDGPL
jgi:hypothetical protein